MTEDLAAQVEHDLLPRPLHVVGLREFQKEAEAEQEDVKRANLGNADQRAGTEPAVQQVMPAALGRQILVNRNDGEQRTKDIGAGLEHNRHQRNGHLPLVRA